MTNEEALRIILSAAEELARYCEKGSTICFDNEFKEKDGEEIREAVAHLTRRATDTANAVPDGLALHNVFSQREKLRGIIRRAANA